MNNDKQWQAPRPPADPNGYSVHNDMPPTRDAARDAPVRSGSPLIRPARAT